MGRSSSSKCRFSIGVARDTDENRVRPIITDFERFTQQNALHDAQLLALGSLDYKTRGPDRSPWAASEMLVPVERRSWQVQRDERLRRYRDNHTAGHDREMDFLERVLF